jgi:hypothetical protein
MILLKSIELVWFSQGATLLALGFVLVRRRPFVRMRETRLKAAA